MTLTFVVWPLNVKKLSENSLNIPLIVLNAFIIFFGRLYAKVRVAIFLIISPNVSPSILVLNVSPSILVLNVSP